MKLKLYISEILCYTDKQEINDKYQIEMYLPLKLFNALMNTENKEEKTGAEVQELF